MLYGRGTDCAALTHILEQAHDDTSCALVIRGEAGVGKTALVDWLVNEAGRRDMGLLTCSGVETESHLPFAGLHQLLRPGLDAMPALPRLQQEALNGALGLSGRRGVDPFLVSVAALSLLGELSGNRGVACLVDDAQWLDTSSADVLRFVARRLDAEGVVLVFAARESEASHFSSPGIREHRLNGLEADAAYALLLDRAPMVSEEVAERLVGHHAGNPLAIIELAPLLTDGQLAGTEPLPDPLPMGGEVERLYASRVSDLSEGTQQLLLLAATADTDDLTLVLEAANALGVSVTSLGEAESSGLIFTRIGTVRFKHPLVRSAVYQRSSFPARQLCHEAMANILTSPSDQDRRAWHLVRAATGHDDALADLLEESADRALARGGPASAADRWQWSADFTRSTEARSRRLLRASDAALMAAQPERSRQLLLLAEPMLSTARERGRARALRGAIEIRHGAPELAYQLLLEAAQTLTDDDPAGALESLVLAGEAATFLGDQRRTSEVGGMAENLRGSAAPTDTTMIDLLVGLGELFEGNWSEGSRLLANVVEDSVGGDDYSRVMRSGRAAMYLGRLAQARDLYARAALHARDAAAPGQLTPMLDRLAYIELLMGRLPDAETHALEGLRLAGDLGLDAGVALASLANTYAYRGEEAACRAQAARAHKVADARQLRMIGASAEWALGLLELGAGRPSEALTHLSSVASDTDGHPGILRWATPDLVEAAVRSGTPEACAPALARLDALASASGLAIPQASLSRCRGLLTTGEEAVAHLEAALQFDDQDTRPLERARTELVLGETLRRNRQRIRARDHLRKATQAFERMAAAPWAERARTELRATGESIARSRGDGLRHLTPQELQIAQYAATGESNADIAAKLFLSRRTIEYHLAKVYTKTGVTSRRELAGTELVAH